MAGVFSSGEFVANPGDIEVRFQLHDAQRVIFNDPHQYKVVAAGRRFGKTFLAAISCIIEGLKDVNDRGIELDASSECLYMAPTFEQAKTIFWPILKQLAAPVTAGTHENTGLLTLVNGVRIRLAGMDNPDRRRGMKLRFAVMDEYADMPAMAWDEIIEPALMDTDGGALFIGTPKGRNHFYEKFLLGQVNHDDVWAAFSFTSRDNTIMPSAARDRMYNDPTKSVAIIKQELEANFISLGGGEFNAKNLRYMTTEPDDGYFVVTVDLAGFSTPDGRGRAKERRDNTAITQIKISRYGWWIKKIDYGRWDVRETALRIMRAAQECHAARIGIEKGALMNAAMPYLEDRMREFPGYFRVIEPLTHGNQRKEERILWSMQGRLDNHRIMVNADSSVSPLQQPMWLQKFIQELSDFPDPHAQDDVIDAVSYADQLGGTIFMDLDKIMTDDWEPLDVIAGY